MDLLELDPNTKLTLVQGEQHINTQLTLTNKTRGCVAFKVKTTAPKSYIVRPSSSTLKAGQEQKVDIIFQKQSVDDLKACSQHRFLVQAVEVKSEEPVSSDRWKEFAKEDIREQRLSVVPPASADEAGRTADFAASGDNYPAASSENLSSKYQQVVQYTLQLERDHRQKQAELEKLKAKPADSAGGGFTNVHLMLVALLSVFLAIATQRML